MCSDSWSWNFVSVEGKQLTSLTYAEGPVLINQEETTPPPANDLIHSGCVFKMKKKKSFYLFL